MDDHRFDHWARSLGSFNWSRRALTRSAIAGILAALWPSFGRDAAAAKCVAPGRKCKAKQGKKKKCCGGAKCKGKKCKCPGNRETCRKTCCAKGATCLAGRCQRCDVCRSGCAFTSVLAAVSAAGAGATIQLCPGTYAGSVTIDKDLALVGAGTDKTILDGLGGLRVLAIQAGAAVVIRDLTVTRGSTTEHGGGIRNSGTLTLDHVGVVSNIGVDGGGIYTAGPLTVRSSRMSGNNASRGGGLFVISTTVALEGSQVEGNQANGWGGGMYITASKATLRNASSVTGNSAVNQTGGGIFSFFDDGTNVTIEAGSSVTGNTPNNCAPPGVVANCSG